MIQGINLRTSSTKEWLQIVQMTWSCSTYIHSKGLIPLLTSKGQKQKKQKQKSNVHVVENISVIQYIKSPTHEKNCPSFFIYVKLNCKEQNTRWDGVMSGHLPSTSRDYSLCIPLGIIFHRPCNNIHAWHIPTLCSLVAQVGIMILKLEKRLGGPKQTHNKQV